MNALDVGSSVHSSSLFFCKAITSLATVIVACSHALRCPNVMSLLSFHDALRVNPAHSQNVVYCLVSSSLASWFVLPVIAGVVITLLSSPGCVSASALSESVSSGVGKIAKMRSMSVRSSSGQGCGDRDREVGLQCNVMLVFSGSFSVNLAHMAEAVLSVGLFRGGVLGTAPVVHQLGISPFLCDLNQPASFGLAGRG